MGLYPVLVCNRWDRLGKDLAARAEDWVSFSCVVDPFGATREQLEDQHFEVARPFKKHWLVNLEVPYEDAVSSHHRYYARYAARNGVEVHRVRATRDKIDVWSRLYDQLIERHDITGIQAFSRAAFSRQFDVPGLVMFFAEYDGQPAAAHLWYEMGDVAYSHLSAQSDAGYDHSASYALHREAIRYFDARVAWLNLGGGAGLTVNADDGLSRFKEGWATDARPSLLCGRVLQPAVYEALAAERGVEDSAYFPTYRAGEE
jgi:hypothetical protein